MRAEVCLGTSKPAFLRRAAADHQLRWPVLARDNGLPLPQAVQRRDPGFKWPGIRRMSGKTTCLGTLKGEAIMKIVRRHAIAVILSAVALLGSPFTAIAVELS